MNMFSPDWDETQSFGRMAREIASAISRNSEIHINKIGPGTPDNSITPVFGGILMGYPSGFQHFGVMGQYGPRLALCMFESTVIPPDWVDPLNRCGAVVVPTRWLVNVFRDCGVKIPIHVVPLGVSESHQYKVRRQKKVFRIVAIGDRGRRKGSHIALFAFAKAFADDLSAELVIKTLHYPFKMSNPNIRLINRPYTNAQMVALYRSADLFVFPTAGEGFGLPPREAAATGALSIATDWGGTADDLAQWGIPLGYKMTEAWKTLKGTYEMEGLGEWAEADVDQLASLMVWAKALPIKVRNDLGKHYAENVRRLYSWDDCAQRILAIYHGLLEAEGGNRRSA